VKTDVAEHVPEGAEVLVKKIIVDLKPGNEACCSRRHNHERRNLSRFDFQRLLAHLVSLFHGRSSNTEKRVYFRTGIPPKANLAKSAAFSFLQFESYQAPRRLQ
jgi:hypothetical protein